MQSIMQNIFKVCSNDTRMMSFGIAMYLLVTLNNFILVFRILTVFFLTLTFIFVLECTFSVKEAESLLMID